MCARPIRDVAFEIADGDGFAFIAANTFRLALRFLRTHAARDRGQGVVAHQTLRGFGDLALRKQVEEMRDVDAHRTAFNTFRVFALKAAFGFEQRDLFAETQADFGKVRRARGGVLFGDVLPRDLQAFLG